jgi:hypothetical protein
MDEIIQHYHLGSKITAQLLIRLSALVRYWEKKLQYNEIVHQLFTDFKNTYDSVRKEVLYSILKEFGVPMKLVRIFKMYSDEIYSKVRMDLFV